MDKSLMLIDHPKVYLIGRQAIDDAELARFLADSGAVTWETDTEVAAERLVEVAGRLCYQSYARPRPGGHAAYVDNIIGSRHGSVVEHAVWNLIVTGVSRSLSHEFVRHRIGMSPSQLSQRYVDESAVPFVVPPALADEVADAAAGLQSLSETTGVPYTAGSALAAVAAGDLDEPGPSTAAGLRWLRAMERDREDYRALSDYLAAKFADLIPDGTARRKAAREAARSVLPNAAETKLFCTFNGRAARHFLEMRASLAADAEIRRLALMMFDVFSAEAPDLFADYRVETSPEGVKYLDTPNRKV
jgi:thymidylate synthase (FAD)